jgi:hypothetical protein
MEGILSKPRQYKQAAALKRDPRAWEVEPVEYRFELDESKPWPLPEPTKREPLRDIFGNERTPIDRDAIKTPFDD